MISKEHFLTNPYQYYKSKYPKKYIVLHHTAGNHHPDFTIDMWNNDKRGAVATTYVIGGKSTKNGDTSKDGLVLQAYPEKSWAINIFYGPNNYQLGIEKQTISIEICNYGFLTEKKGKFYNYVGGLVPNEDVITLETPFKGFKHWHNYTDKQIENLGILLKEISDRNGINLAGGISAIVKACFEDTRTYENTITLQQTLRYNGFKGLNNKALYIDGVFGPQTEHALLSAGGPQIAFEYLYSTEARYALKDAKTGLKGPIDGIYSHTSFRNYKSRGGGKVDVYPHPKIINLLKNC